MARAHRIGQTRAVRVYRLLTAKTYEMHMFHSASMKLGLDRAVLAHQRQHEADANQNGPKQTSKSERETQAREIDALLKKGAYDVFRDEDDEEAKQFMETDIDDLLKTSSRTVTYGNDNNSMSSGLGSFSKASFVTGDGGAEEVDLDDPDFWQKAVGLDAPPNDPGVDNETTMLLAGLESKRSRKQVQVYDPYAAFAERERKKQEKITAKLKTEKEEKDRKKREEKRKRKEEKDRKLKEKNEAKQAAKEKVAAATAAAASAVTATTTTTVPQKPIQAHNVRMKAKAQPKEVTKKVRRSEKRKLQRAAEEKIYETIKQIWKGPQRDRLTASFLRFGFGRFTKVRCDANLLSFPIQDIEVFLRSCKLKSVCTSALECAIFERSEMSVILTGLHVKY